ncbi:MAG: hypothetical protein HC945_02675 [Nitrosarchaeum sp.]|nr:hypothetical protein [Nitrosarchaeum sp.]
MRTGDVIQRITGTFRSIVINQQQNFDVLIRGDEIVSIYFTGWPNSSYSAGCWSVAVFLYENLGANGVLLCDLGYGFGSYQSSKQIYPGGDLNKVLLETPSFEIATTSAGSLYAVISQAGGSNYVRIDSWKEY